MRPRLLWLLVIGLGVSLATACDDDDPVRQGTNPDPIVEPTTPDLLIANLELAYTDRNLNEYARILGNEFEFLFAPEDRLQRGGSVEFWQRAEELVVTERMFSGQPGSAGAPIQSITLQLEAVDDWSAEVAPEFAGSVVRSYCVSMDVTAGETIFQIRGLQRFYAATTENAEQEEIYVLRAWQDLGVLACDGFKNQASETRSWGSFKLLFAN